MPGIVSEAPASAVHATAALWGVDGRSRPSSSARPPPVPRGLHPRASIYQTAILMHGNAPHAGDTPQKLDAEQRSALRQSVASVTADTRALLPDEFMIGSEIVDSDQGAQATVAVRPPVGSTVRATVSLDSERAIAQKLAAAAAVQVKQSHGRMEGAG